MTKGDPFGYLGAGFRVVQLGVEAHAVVWMRMMGLAGAWNTPFDEGYRMWREKPDAFAEALGRATQEAWRGSGPDRVVTAMVGPLTQEAAANRQRLEDRGARR